MILLADAGSTKTDWCLVKDGKQLIRIETKGINPFFQTEEEIAREIEGSLFPHLPKEGIHAVYFYGAGCAFAEKNKIVADAIARYVNAPIEVGSDMLAAARGLCGTEAGIACIMGTGSNSCFYNGREVVKNVSPLGFILGDEGSGAVLGKLLVADCLKNQLPTHLQELFFEQFSLTRADILDKVYKQSFPNRFLAGLSPFLAQHLDEPEVYRLVHDSFEAFFTRNVIQYEWQRYPVHFAGSIAHHYQTVLRAVAEELNITVGRIVKSPMEGLGRYHGERSGE